ncbi:MAG: hypothetical protein KDH20_19485 [Rhodocyclaceae bacterium]|nr:hypothetical protein [Rhodocyclaceae bacterium]
MMQEAGRKGDRGAVAEGRESNPVDHTLAIRRALAPLRFDDMPDRHEAHHDYAWLWRQDVKQWLMRAYGIGTRVRWELAQLDEDATPALAERVGEISYAELVAVVWELARRARSVSPAMHAAVRPLVLARVRPLLRHADAHLAEAAVGCLMHWRDRDGLAEIARLRESPNEWLRRTATLAVAVLTEDAAQRREMAIELMAAPATRGYADTLLELVSTRGALLPWDDMIGVLAGTELRWQQDVFRDLGKLDTPVDRTFLEHFAQSDDLEVSRSAMTLLVRQDDARQAFMLEMLKHREKPVARLAQAWLKPRAGSLRGDLLPLLAGGSGVTRQMVIELLSPPFGDAELAQIVPLLGGRTPETMRLAILRQLRGQAAHPVVREALREMLVCGTEASAASAARSLRPAADDADVTALRALALAPRTVPGKSTALTDFLVEMASGAADALLAELARCRHPLLCRQADAACRARGVSPAEPGAPARPAPPPPAAVTPAPPPACDLSALPTGPDGLLDELVVAVASGSLAKMLPSVEAIRPRATAAALPALSAWLEPQAPVPVQIKSALAGIVAGVGGAEAIRHLVVAFRRSDDTARSIADWLRRLGWTPESPVDEARVRLCKGWGGPLPPPTEGMLEAVARFVSTQPDIDTAGLEFLIAQPGPVAARALALADPAGSVRADVRKRMLKRLRDDAAVAADALVERLRDDLAQRQAPAPAWAASLPSDMRSLTEPLEWLLALRAPQGREIALAVLDEPRLDSRCRRPAAELLCVLRDRSATGRVLALFEETVEVADRRALVEALGRLRDPAALTVLRAAREGEKHAALLKALDKVIDKLQAQA